jgi:hypothetical protein
VRLRADLVRLQRRVRAVRVRGRAGRRARAALGATLAAGSAGLAHVSAFAQSGGESRVAAAGTSFARAGQQARRARRFLGCRRNCARVL